MIYIIADILFSYTLTFLYFRPTHLISVGEKKANSDESNKGSPSNDVTHQFKEYYGSTIVIIRQVHLIKIIIHFSVLFFRGMKFKVGI